MSRTIVIALFLVAVFCMGATAPGVYHHHVPETGGEEDASAGASFEQQVVRIALYDCGWNNRYFDGIFNYSWEHGNMSYRFEATVVDADDVRGDGDVAFSIERFDVLLIGASASAYLVDGVDEAWRDAVQQFVADGGGYLGICGGANTASMGFEEPRSLFQRRVNRGVLRIADVYINDDVVGEWQYLLKFGFDAFGSDHGNGSYPYYASVNTTLADRHPIFAGYDGDARHITYAGGPGMTPAGRGDGLHGQVSTMLRYGEEPMETMPLHYWRPTLHGWTIWKNVTTDIEDSAAAVATSYGEGNVVLYGPHPEHRVVVNGTVREYLGHGIPNFAGPVERYVFNYFGEMLSHDYNWWIVRRSAAWAAGLSEPELPPVG
jgi:hypothetical protein